MLGFAFANPSIAVTLQDYRQYVSEVIKDDSPDELESIGKFFKRTTHDSRQKVLWVNGVSTLRRIQQDWPAEKMANVLIGVFDAGENLAKVDHVKIVDADLDMKSEADKIHQTWRMHTYNLTAAMTGAATGYEIKAKKFVQPEQPTKLTPVAAPAAAPAAPAVKRGGLPQDSLSRIFDSMLTKVPEAKRGKAAGLIAARLEGILTKEEWLKALERLEKYGLPADLIKGALRAYKDAGHLAPLRSAVRAMVVDGIDDPDIAAQTTNARTFDVLWVIQRWPLENVTAEMLGA